MKVLFISSDRSKGVSEIIKAQGDSLIQNGIKIDYYTITPGIKGYIRSIWEIKSIFSNKKYDLAHAHYSYSGFAAALAGACPLVVSLMGSDIFESSFSRIFSRMFIKTLWNVTIVKSQGMKNILKSSTIHVIPNGVNIERFKPISTEIARSHIGYNGHKKLIVFVANPARAEKNFSLAEKAVSLISEFQVTLLPVFNTPQAEIPYFINAADLILLTSKWEGSVNIVKEAMSCNIPIISTDVGDVNEVVNKTNGCYITTSDVNDIVMRINDVLSVGTRTKGRNRIISLGLDSKSIAERIISIYNELAPSN